MMKSAPNSSVNRPPSPSLSPCVTASADLCLLLDDGLAFHVVADVVLAQSAYLQRFAQWTSSPVIRIALPALRHPLRRPPEGRAASFGAYLRAVTDPTDALADCDPDQVAAVFQIADFLQSASVVRRCDARLAAGRYGAAAPALARFCQAWAPALPATMTALKRAIAADLVRFRHDPVLYDLDAASFADIVRWSDDDFVWPFWIVVCYAGRRPLRQNYVDLDVRIESASMTDLFQDLVRCVCARLRPQARRRIASDLRQRRIWFDPPIADANVLERLVSP